MFYAPFHATHALGFYASEDVTVDLVDPPAPGAATAGLLDRSIWRGADRCGS